MKTKPEKATNSDQKTFLICCTPKCRTKIKLTKQDLQFRKQVESLGFGMFSKLCKKHELEMIARHNVKI